MTPQWGHFHNYSNRLVQKGWKIILFKRNKTIKIKYLKVQKEKNNIYILWTVRFTNSHAVQGFSKISTQHDWIVNYSPYIQQMAAVPNKSCIVFSFSPSEKWSNWQGSFLWSRNHTFLFPTSGFVHLLHLFLVEKLPADTWWKTVWSKMSEWNRGTEIIAE